MNEVPEGSITALYDKISKFHRGIACYRNSGEAIRAFTGAFLKSEELQNNSDDFSLVELGRFDDISGRVIPHREPLVLVRASSLLDMKSSIKKVADS